MSGCHHLLNFGNLVFTGAGFRFEPINFRSPCRARSGTVWTSMAYQHFFGRLETIPSLLSDDLPYWYIVMAACYFIGHIVSIRANAVTSTLSKRDGYENNSLNSETTPKTLGPSSMHGSSVSPCITQMRLWPRLCPGPCWESLHSPRSPRWFHGFGTASVRHVRGVWSNRAVDFRGPPFFKQHYLLQW